MCDDLTGSPVSKRELFPGDAVILTLNATQSILDARQGFDTGDRAVGILLEKLENFNDDVVWGILVDNGYLEQVLDSEIEEVFPLERV